MVIDDVDMCRLCVGIRVEEDGWIGCVTVVTGAADDDDDDDDDDDTGRPDNALG